MNSYLHFRIMTLQLGFPTPRESGQAHLLHLKLGVKRNLRGKGKAAKARKLELSKLLLLLLAQLPMWGWGGRGEATPNRRQENNWAERATTSFNLSLKARDFMATTGAER